MCILGMLWDHLSSYVDQPAVNVAVTVGQQLLDVAGCSGMSSHVQQLLTNRTSYKQWAVATVY